MNTDFPPRPKSRWIETVELIIGVMWAMAFVAAGMIVGTLIAKLW
jgi:hypothetical protein